MPRRTQWDLPRHAYATARRATLNRKVQRPIHRDKYVNYIKYADDPKQVKLGSNQRSKAMLCLLIAAHNEELVIEKTLRSAIAAGMDPKHIYVVDDNSSDPTSKLARAIIPAKNVVKVRRSGKGLALTKATKKFQLTKRYRWIHIADADGAFAPNYFSVFRKNLRVEYAAATGYMKSLPGRRVSEYRIVEYTMGMEIHRRVQDLFGVIPIIPGPTSCFRSDVFEKVDFDTKALTEDFDVTLQLYRQGLGKIQFIPDAVAYTQDPPDTRSFVKQITRWNRGVLQGVTRHRIGSKFTAIDAYLGYQILMSVMLFMNCFAWIPYMVLQRHGGLRFMATVFLMDVFITFLMSFYVSIKARRFDAVSAFPIVYAYKWVSLVVFTKCFIEVIVLRKYRVSAVGHWENKSYKMANA